MQRLPASTVPNKYVRKNIHSANPKFLTIYPPNECDKRPDRFPFPLDLGRGALHIKKSNQSAYLEVKTADIMIAEPPLVPVSWGELVDKITILEIKCARLRAPEAAANAARELRALVKVLAPVADEVAAERAALMDVNTRLWNIEDAIREKEAAQDFGDDFVALARAVYRENDERGRIKAAINRMLRSPLVEEKQYSRY